MSVEIEKHYVQTYQNTVQMLAQKMLSQTEQLVTVQPCSGVGAAIADQFGAVTAKKKTERHEDTKYSDTPRDRRWLMPSEYYSAELVDKSDVIRLLTDPQSSLARVHVAAMNRAKDQEFFDQIFALANRGELPTTGTVAYNTGNDLAADIEVSGTPAGLTVTKLIKGKQGFIDRFVDLSGDPLAILVPGKGWADMFGQTQFTSSDYNGSATAGGKPLNDMSQNINFGNINIATVAHAGFTANGTTEWYCPMFVKSGVVMGVWQDIEVEVQKVPQKVSSYEVKVTGRWAVTRVEEAKVARVKIKYA